MSCECFNSPSAFSLDRLWRSVRDQVTTYKEDSSSEEDEVSFTEGLDFSGEEADPLETVETIRRRRSSEADLNTATSAFEGLGPVTPATSPTREFFTPVQVRFPVNAPEFRPPVEMPPAVVAFESENGTDDAKALQEALRYLDRLEWSDTDVKFFFQKAEIKMSAVGVKKQYTKFQVLSSIIPNKIQEEVKGLLVKVETDFPDNNAYLLLKTEILRIFGPRPETAVERALSRVLVDKPSSLARQLVNDLCQKQLKDCNCCPPIVAALWKRQLGNNVRAGIAHCQFNADTFNSVIQLADDIHSTNLPVGNTMAAVTANQSLNETLPAINYPIPEVAAVRGAARGRGGRRNRGRGGRGGGQSGQNSQSGAQAGQPKHKGAKHPDLPAGEWTGCSMHFRWGRGSYFCNEPATCPWKNVFTPKPPK